MGKVMHTDVNPGFNRLHLRGFAEMRGTMLTLNRVIGLTTIDPAAVHTDAHAQWF